MKANLNNGIRNLLLGRNNMNPSLKGLVSYLAIPLLLAASIIFFSIGNANISSQQSHGTVYYTSLSPANLTQTLNDQPSFTFVSYSDKNTTYSCTLYIDDIPYGTNSSVQNNTETTITANDTLSPGDHIWYINCTDSEGTYKSEVRTIGIGANFSRCAVLVDSETYYLNGSILDSSTPSCINITANNVVLDCQGNTIDGDDATNYGIYIYRDSAQTTNITIRDCTVTDWTSKAIYLRNANGNTLENLVIESNTNSQCRGISLEYSDFNTLKNITANSNYYGIYLDYSHNNSLSNITARDSSDLGAGIGLRYSDSNNLTNITATGSGMNLYIYYSDYIILKNAELINSTYWDIYFVTGLATMDCHSQFVNVTGTDNKPIVFFNSSVHIQNWNNNVSEIILCGADYSVIDNLTMNHTDKNNNGLILTATQHANITNSLFANLREGIFVYGGNYNKITNITLLDISFKTIDLKYEADYNIFENISTRGGKYGIYIDMGSGGNIFNKITAKNSEYGIYVWTSNNNFTNSKIENCTYGFYIYGNSTVIEDSSISNSTITDIYLFGSNRYIYLTNTTFDKANVTVKDSSKIVVKWYLDICVNSTSGKSLSGANVTGWQSNGTQVFTELTNSSGCIQRKTLIEYIQNSSQVYPDNVTYYTPYTINASKTGYYANSTQINLTQSLATYITLHGEPPEITWYMPADDNSTIVNGTLIHNITFEDENLYMVNCTIYSDSAMTNPVWTVQYNLTGNTTWTLTDEVNISNWTDGIYYENCTVTDFD